MWGRCTAASLWAPAMAEEAVRGIGTVYTELLQPQRASQVEFLKTLVHKFKASCSFQRAHADLPDIRCGTSS